MGDYEAARHSFRDALAEGGPVSNSKIVLAHDIREETVHELAAFMIRGAREQGFQLVTIGECLGDDKRNWYRNLYDGDSWKRSPAEGGRNSHDKNERLLRVLECPWEAEGHRLDHHTVTPPRARVEAPSVQLSFPLERKQKPLTGISDIRHSTNIKHDEHTGPRSENRCVVSHGVVGLPEDGLDHIHEEDGVDVDKARALAAGTSELRVPLSTVGILMAWTALFLRQ